MVSAVQLWRKIVSLVAACGILWPMALNQARIVQKELKPDPKAAMLQIHWMLYG